MARIVRVLDGSQEVHAHPSEVDCYVQFVRDSDDRLLVHVSTFGSADRQSPPKSIQSMQFDREAARALVDYFVRAFGDDVVASGPVPERLFD